MPGPGPHIGYALTAGLGMMRLSRGRFSPQHCLFYAANAFLGPDLGSFAEWLARNLAPGGGGGGIGHLAMTYVHHPLYYVALLGLPLAVFYSWFSRVLLEKGLLDSFSGIHLSRKQCFLLVAAGSFTHFFLDHLFEENGHSDTYTWILSTGWWEGRAPNTPEAVLVVGLLCSTLIAGFIYINRVNPGKSIMTRAKHSMGLVLLVMSLYCVWCYSQIYWRSPPQPAVGEEADLGWWEGRAPNTPEVVLVVGLLLSTLIEGFIYFNRVNPGKSITKKAKHSIGLVLRVMCLYCVWCYSQIYWRSPPQPTVGEEANLGVIVFLAIYFFRPHSLCILSMNQK